jgi:hypothetical protein
VGESVDPKGSRVKRNVCYSFILKPDRGATRDFELPVRWQRAAEKVPQNLIRLVPA